MNQVTLDNERAKHAFDKVKKQENNKEYLSICKKAPSQIKVNGFGMTMAYLYSKKDSKQLYYDIVEWLKKRLNDQQIKKVSHESFLEIIVKCNSSVYRQMSKETMALLIWMKRFAEGMLK